MEGLSQYDIHTIRIKQIDDGIEGTIFQVLTKEDFLEKIVEEGINIDTLIREKKKENTMFHKFNYLLKDLHMTGELNIVTAITCFEEDYSYKSIMKCVNAENTLMIRNYLIKEHKIDVEKLKAAKKPKKLKKE